jgi:four helix bundle protein
MSNIAEGFSRNSDKDFAHFLDIAKGSVLEVQSLLYVALDVGYIAKEDFERLYRQADTVVSLPGGLILYLRKRFGL